jgi:hypothetical protein
MGALAAVEPWFARLARAIRSRSARGSLDQGDGAARRVRRQSSAHSCDRFRR